MIKMRDTARLPSWSRPHAWRGGGGNEFLYARLIICVGIQSLAEQPDKHLYQWNIAHVMVIVMVLYEVEYMGVST
jgi:hypothetical protein